MLRVPVNTRRSVLWVAAAAVVVGLVYLMATASTGPVDPTEIRRMLILTGVLVGVVLVVMIGGTALSFVDLGWLPRHDTPFTLPQWLGAWFEVYSVWETLTAQALAAGFVVGSYYAAEYLKVTRPRRRGEAIVAHRATEAPGQARGVFR